jgi:ribonuclease P protein component
MTEKSENIAEEKSNLTFKKEERLCSKKIIDKLFLSGESILSFPVKIVFLWVDVPSKYPAQVGFSVGKKSFKKAVDRNLIKRRMREAYRLNKNELYRGLNKKQLALFFIFIGKTIPEYHLVESAIKKGIKKILKEIE